MNFSISLFFIHLSTWIFLYIFPLVLAFIIVLLVGLFFKHLIFTTEGNSIRHKKTFTYEEKRASIEEFSIKIEFIFKAFFYGLIISAIVLSIYLWLYEF
ncbi:MAG: hypothetical protein KA146_06135 [Leptospiraceae bacterium]|jgi:hypothetical protein|nr:hypothetical protein [Leptospiraceae bacterium]